MVMITPYLGLLVGVSAHASWLNRHLVFIGGAVGFVSFHILQFGLKFDPGIAALWSLIAPVGIGIIGSAIWRGKFDLERLPEMLRVTMKGGKIS